MAKARRIMHIVRLTASFIAAVLMLGGPFLFWQGVELLRGREKLGPEVTWEEIELRRQYRMRALEVWAGIAYIISGISYSVATVGLIGLITFSPSAMLLLGIGCAGLVVVMMACLLVELATSEGSRAVRLEFAYEEIRKRKQEEWLRPKLPLEF